MRIPMNAAVSHSCHLCHFGRGGSSLTVFFFVGPISVTIFQVNPKISTGPPRLSLTRRKIVWASHAGLFR